MPLDFSRFARNITVETAFSVLARARQLAAEGKQVIELEIGDSPFATTAAAKQGGLEAIGGDQGQLLVRRHAARLAKKHPTLSRLKGSLRKRGLLD